MLGLFLSKSSIRFEVSINGVVQCIAGVENFGVLSAIITRVKRTPSDIHEKIRAREGFNENAYLQENIDVSMGGLDSSTNEHVNWIQQNLKIGDVVSVRLLGEGEYDTPQKSVF